MPQLSRFELDELKPFEIMFCDNKDYEQPARGGKQITFIDCKVQVDCKVQG